MEPRLEALQKAVTDYGQESVRIFNVVRKCGTKILRIQIIGYTAALLLLGIVGIQMPGLSEMSDDASRFAFELDLSVKTETLRFVSVVRCQEYDLGTGTPGKSVPHYAVRAKSLGQRLSNGQGVFVVIPDVCSYLQDTDGRHLNGERLRGEWPTIQEPRRAVPLVYITDSFDDPQSVTMFANPAGPTDTSNIASMTGSVRQIREPGAVESLDDEAAGADPFDPQRGSKKHWTGLVFLPTFLSVAPQSDWFAESIHEGSCQFALVNRAGQEEISKIDPYAEYLGDYWPMLWQSIAPSEVQTERRLTQDQMANIEQGLALAIPVTYASQNTRTVDLEARGEIRLYPEADFIRGMHDFTQYLIGQKRFSTRESDIHLRRGRLPIIALCDGRVYRPVVLNFAFETLD
jgi:hypothetical protein